MHTDIARSELDLFISLCKWQAVSWIVSKGGYEKHRSLVFLSIPPVPSRATSCSRLFADGCRCSCQASLNDMVGGFELSATGLYVFVVAFCVLQLRARCLHLCSIFPLNVLALLHRCYMEGLWDRESIGALLLYVSRSIVSYPGCGLFSGLLFAPPEKPIFFSLACFKLASHGA